MATQPEFTERISSLEQAEHNYKVCILLNSKGEFNDWVITTAFYSALHFVRHVAFPMVSEITDTNNQKISFKYFDIYSSYLQSNKRSGETLTPHEIMISLSEKVLPSDISARYKYLYDICMTARYRNYRIKNFTSKICMQYLESIAIYARNHNKSIEKSN